MKPESNNILLLRVGPLLPLLLLTFCWQIAASAGVPPATVQPAGGIYSLGAAVSFAGDLDCVADDGAEEEVLQTRGFPADLPGGTDKVPSVSASRANLPSRCDQEAPQTTSTTLDSIALRQPGFVPAFLFSVPLAALPNL